MAQKSHCKSSLSKLWLEKLAMGMVQGCCQELFAPLISHHWPPGPWKFPWYMGAAPQDWYLPPADTGDLLFPVCPAVITCFTLAHPQICDRDIIEIPPEAFLLSVIHLLNAVPSVINAVLWL